MASRYAAARKRRAGTVWGLAAGGVGCDWKCCVAAVPSGQECLHVRDSSSFWQCFFPKHAARVRCHRSGVILSAWEHRSSRRPDIGSGGAVRELSSKSFEALYADAHTSLSKPTSRRSALAVPSERIDHESGQRHVRFRRARPGKACFRRCRSERWFLASVAMTLRCCANDLKRTIAVIA